MWAPFFIIFSDPDFDVSDPGFDVSDPDFVVSGIFFFTVSEFVRTFAAPIEREEALLWGFEHNPMARW